MRKMAVLLLLLLLIISACSTSRQKLSPQGNLNLKSANVYYQQGENGVDKAYDYYNKVLEDNPDHILALKRLADINLYYAEKRYIAKSVEYNQKAYQNYSKVLQVLATFSELKEDEKVMKRDATKKKESAWVRIFNTGKSLMVDKAYTEAEATFETLYNMDTTRIEPLKMLVAVNQELKNDQNIQLYLSKILAVAPNDPEMIRMMGTYYYNKSDWEKALDAFQKTRVVAPGDINNLMLIASCHTEMKEYGKALEVLEQVLTYDPEKLDAMESAKDIARVMKDHDKEFMYWQKIILKDPTPENLKEACISMGAANRNNDALAFAEQWYNMDKEDKEAVQFCLAYASQAGRTDLVKKYNEILISLP